MGSLLTTSPTLIIFQLVLKQKKKEKFEVRVAQHLGKINQPSLAVGSVQLSHARADCIWVVCQLHFSHALLEGLALGDQGTHLSENRYIR